MLLDKAKNQAILVLSAVVLIASFIVHFLHRVLNVSEAWGYEAANQIPMVTNAILVIPVILFVVSVLLFRKQKNHSQLPLFNTLTITFSSISMIAGGEGMIEYHFSIFMVVAMIGYYESIRLITIMTAVFAVQHLAGFFFISEYVFGTEAYPLSMIVIHAVFLIGTSGAIIWQTRLKRKLIADLDEKEQKNQILSEIIDQLSTNSEKITRSSAELKENATSNQTALKEMVASIQEISSEADTQREQTMDSSQVIQEVASGIEQIAQTSSQVSAGAKHTTDKVSEGNGMIQRTVQQMNDINQRVHTSSDSVQALSHRSKEIEEIVEIITDIADQTNLLALNAAIEAARAGEHGKGFAVVADEVRKLAEQSGTSAGKITELVHAIQKDTKTSSEAMDQVTTEVKEGLEVVHKTGAIFNQIHTSVEDVASQIKEISASAEEVSTATEQASSAIQEMASFAQTASDRAQEVAESSGTQLSSVEFLSDLIDTLDQVTHELKGLITQTEKLHD
ncbi:hypothetical protein GCM10008986_12700 [Salinibacillus aidingensis]|uniref:Methyl-accepting transducer domain-containing protein n=1 Tax=Salinibacillus aidingensis TaxID=237684 RepID=A0ABP3KWK4_9BACI